MTAPPRWLTQRLTADDLDAIAASVTNAEAGTSAEIRVHLEPNVPRARFRQALDPLDRAREIFASLGMEQTRDRNGVLVYIALDDHKFAIFGDEGIHARVVGGYWQAVADLMRERLRRGATREAIVTAVEELGRALASHFPRRPDDVDELSNRVSVE